MAVDCLQSTAKMTRRHRSLSMSLEPLAMMFTFLLVSSHVIVISFGLPIPDQELSPNTTDASNGTANTTNTTSLCAGVKCEPGQECIISGGNVTICVTKSHPEKESDCSVNQVCGNDGITYSNDCEMKENGVTLKHSGPCFSCQNQTEKFAKYKDDPNAFFNEKIQLLIGCNSITINDVLNSNIFEPECSEKNPDVFLLDQSFKVADTCIYYWCSTPDGVVIEDTFQREKVHCQSRSTCVHDGKEYKDGDVFKPDCGICECLDGEIKCINDFCGVRGNLTDDQLNVLRSDIYQLFYFQFQFSDHKLIDLRHIRENPAKQDSEDIACSVLYWKFSYYDVNEDGELQANEQHKFIDEVHDIINFAEFDKQMKSKIDTNQDKVFQFSEWFTYFTADAAEGKGKEWSCEPSTKTR